MDSCTNADNLAETIIPTLAALCTEVVTKHTRQSLMHYYNLASNGICISPDAALLYEPCCKKRITQLMISDDGQRVVTHNEKNTIHTHSLRKKETICNGIKCTSGALVATCGQKIVAVSNESIFDQLKTKDTLAHINDFATYTPLASACFVHSKTAQLLRIEPKKFSRLTRIHSPQGVSLSWKLLRKTPDIVQTLPLKSRDWCYYTTTPGGSWCMYQASHTTNDRSFVLSNIRIINMDKYIENSKAQGVLIACQNPSCFALSKDGTYAAIGYCGISHMYKLQNILTQPTPCLSLKNTKRINIYDITWSIEHSYTITIDQEGTVLFYAQGKSTPFAHITPHNTPPYKFALNNPSTHLAVGYRDGSIAIIPLIRVALIASFVERHKQIAQEKVVDIKTVENAQKLLNYLQTILSVWHKNGAVH